MLSQQRSLLRLILLPSAFSSSFRSAGWSTFLLFNARQRANARQAWASNSHDVTTKDDGVIALGDQWKDVSSVLVCGDGDLSYSACVAQQLSSPESNDVALTATVLEKEQVHNSVYKNSQQNADKITSFPRHEVCFGIDATRLSSYFEEATFDRIIFNFPHWRGKANNRRNRELLSAFLGSASQVLDPDGGLIQVALCQGQGGATASTAEEWKQSWTAALYAAEHGLLLLDVEPYEPFYNLSSHRGVDRPFRIGSSPKLYSFAFPNDEPVTQSIQLCCRHELHLVMPSNDERGGIFSREGLMEGDQVLEFVRKIVPNSIRVEVPIRQVLTSSETGGGPEMIVLLIVYCGERKELTRAEADSYRDKVETEISQHLELRENRKGRLVSRPFPYPLLQELIDKHVG